MQTQTLFIVAQDLSKMQIETNVSEADIGQVKEGQEVEFKQGDVINVMLTQPIDVPVN